MDQLDSIQNCIFEFRGQRVMVDRDLADLYGVATKALFPNSAHILLLFCYQRRGADIGMPGYRVRDVKSHSKGCLLWGYRRHPLLSWKASERLVEGIGTRVRRHPYERTPYFAMSG